MVNQVCKLMEFLNSLDGPLGQRLTWTLLHFLWQGAVLAGLLESVIYLCGVRSLTARYRLALATLLLMAACPIVTFRFVQPAPLISEAPPQPEIERTMPRDLPAAGPPIVFGGPESPDALPVAPLETPAVADPAPPPPPRVSALARWQPWLLGGWAIGAGLLGLRLLIGGGMAWRMRRGRRPLDPEWADRARRLALRLGVRRAAVFVSARVRQALVAGVWRPMVLLPAAWLAEMPPEMLEGVLAHELAHLRRLDLWAILLQRLVETFLFYHPAVWWLSRRLSREREMCCDEMAVAATGDRLAFTEALQWAAQRPAAGSCPVLGAAWKGNQKMVIERIRRLLGADMPRERFSWWPLGLAALVVPVLLMVSATTRLPRSEAVAEEPPTIAAGDSATRQAKPSKEARQRGFRVNFVGNTFVSSERLKTLIDSHAPYSNHFSDERDRKKLDEDVSKLTAYYRSFGFFHARIDREVEFDEKQNCATVTFVIDEGPRYSVRNVSFLGNRKLDNARLAAKLKLLSGQPFDQNQQTLDLQKLRDEYVSGGYVFAKVEADYRFLEEPGKLNIVYNIEEGARYHISRLNLNRLPVKPGDVVDAREIRNSGGPLKAAQLYNSVGVNPDAGLVGDITLDDRAEPKIVSSARGTAPAAKPAPPAGVPTPAAAAAMVEVKVAVLEVDRAKLRTSATELQSLGVDLDKLPATLDADKHEAIVTALLRHGLAEVVMRPQVMVLSGVKACVNVGLTEFELLPTVLDKDRVRVECHLRKKSPATTFEFNTPLEMRLGRTTVVSGSRLQPAKSDEQIVVLMTVKLAEGKVNKSPSSAASHETAGEVYRIEPPDVIRIEVTRFPGGKAVLEGLYLVGPDGTINLRQYGVPSVAGLSAREVERRIVKAVSRKESDGEYSARVEVTSNNSKVVYVIFSAKDDRVVRVPADQSTTVASALLQVEGAAAQAAKETVWVARPRRNSGTNRTETEVKSIDWRAIVERGSVEANLHLQPGDRIFIGRRPPEGGISSGEHTGFHVLEVGADGVTFIVRYARLSYSQANDQMIFEGDGQCDAELYKQGQDGAVSPFKAQKIIYFKKTGEMIVNGFHSLAIPKANEPPTKAPAAKPAAKYKPAVRIFDKDDSLKETANLATRA